MDPRSKDRGEQDPRKFIRHTVDVPVEIVEFSGSRSEDHSVDISYGGLSFESDACLELGGTVFLRIATVDPPFEGEGRVVWCRPENGRFLVGVQFLDAETAFRSRMIEQVCSIENYRKEVERDEGRVLTSSEAAAEWIQKYAARFPKSNGEA